MRTQGRIAGRASAGDSPAREQTGMATHPTVSTDRKQDVPERFRRLAREWKEQSRYLSNAAQMAMLRPYQRIIGMGEAAVPMILEELRREPDHWFWALEAITEDDPVPPEDVGK